MKFVIETWPVKKLISTLDKGLLNLNPPYQRNAIWPKSTQKFLINSIKEGHPIPNLFLFLKEDGSYEMVDGQQRTRAIRLYQSSDEINFLDDDKSFKNGAFLEFQISIIIITHIEENENIEDFYYMVNSSGIKLNRPETLKAQYFDKRFLELVEELTNNENFVKLNIIPTTSQKRMLDRDLIEELCALIIYGITDKKIQVDKIYETDLTESEAKNCKSSFLKILSKINLFDGIKPIKNTRYRQRNDFYTLVNFLNENIDLPNETLEYFYKILIELEKGIKPNRSACPILSEYAFNCVSQSNSATARKTRLEIFNKLFLNSNGEPNNEQKQVQDFYPEQGEYFVKANNYLTFNLDVLAAGINNKGLIEQED